MQRPITLSDNNMTMTMASHIPVVKERLGTFVWSGEYTFDSLVTGQLQQASMRATGHQNCPCKIWSAHKT